MTINLTIATYGLIVMTVDSAVMLDFGNSREYEKGKKSYFYNGVGCVTTWGSRDHNKIGRYLQERNISKGTHTIHNLADFVEEYLLNEYKPHELDLDDVGYHVAGFDAKRVPFLSHIFYGFDRPRTNDQVAPKYARNNHSPLPKQMVFLYNGRNDLVELVIRSMESELTAGGDIRYDLGNPIELVQFSDFVARFAAELTPQVGPPFITRMISTTNESVTVRNRQYTPLNREKLKKVLKKIGFATDSL